MISEKEKFNARDVARNFSRAASQYDDHAFIQYEVGQRLLERLNGIKSTPSLIVDVGAGTGKLTCQLQQRFPKSTVLGLDLAQGMMHYAAKKQSWRPWQNQPRYLCADMHSLPLKNQSVDLIFSNCTLQWGNDLKNIFLEFKRVLSPNGLLLFSTFGPQTLYELRQSFNAVDNKNHVHAFLDMHDMGDLLLNTAFTDPVVDMEMLTLSYTDMTKLLKDLKGVGASNLDVSRRKGCTTPTLFKKMVKAYDDLKGDTSFYPATYEVIYGCAWQSPMHLFYKQDADGLIKIPADKIPLL